MRRRRSRFAAFDRLFTGGVIVAGLVWLFYNVALPQLSPSNAGVPAASMMAAIGGPSASTVNATGASAAPAASAPTDPAVAGSSDEPSIVRASPAGCHAPPYIKPATVVHHGSRDAKVVALTFDDGYNPENTAKILSILVKAKVNATFMPIGRAIHSEPATWKSVAAAGYPIGDHTYDHPNLAGLCFAAQVTQLLRQQSLLRSLGIDPLPLMRPPGGNFDWLTKRAATDTGNADVVLWDIDTRDWSGISARSIAARALAGTNGSIVLMHTMPDNTVRALPKIIAGYKARGFTFVTLGQLLGVPGAIPFP
jgi:peptidoglycan/xylan/chitin deacetylase (PgdA/CDA1 family)